MPTKWISFLKWLTPLVTTPIFVQRIWFRLSVCKCNLWQAIVAMILGGDLRVIFLNRIAVSFNSNSTLHWVGIEHISNLNNSHQASKGRLTIPTMICRLAVSSFYTIVTSLCSFVCSAKTITRRFFAIINNLASFYQIF